MVLPDFHFGSAPSAAPTSALFPARKFRVWISRNTVIATAFIPLADSNDPPHKRTIVIDGSNSRDTLERRHIGRTDRRRRAACGAALEL